MKNNYDELYIFVPDTKEIIYIAEGSGNNLSIHDLELGFVDYIYYAQHSLEDSLEEVDGGMVMLRQEFRDKFSCTEEAISDVLDMAYSNKKLKYIILK